MQAKNSETVTMPLGSYSYADFTSYFRPRRRNFLQLCCNKFIHLLNQRNGTNYALQVFWALGKNTHGVYK